MLIDNSYRSSFETLHSFFIYLKTFYLIVITINNPFLIFHSFPQVQGNPILVNPSLNPAAAAPYILKGGIKNQAVPTKVDQTIVMQVTQPLLESNGIVKWALSNVIHPDTPPCEAVLNQVYENDNWVQENAMQPTFNGLEGYYTFPMSGVSVQGPADTRLQVGL